MRLTCFGIVLALAAGFWADRTLAQPTDTAQTETVVETDSNGAVANGSVASETVWEKNFSHTKSVAGGAIQEVPMGGAPLGTQLQTGYGQGAGYASSCNTTPYLAWHRCPITGRIHLIPYQKGYASAPDEFPTKQNAINFWLSSLPCRTQDRPQQKYLGYYDSMPEIITDKPSRCQLILGYPDGNWTSSCQTDCHFAHCPGVDLVARGPLAEQSVTNQEVCQGLFGGLCPTHGRNCPMARRNDPRYVTNGQYGQYGQYHNNSYATGYVNQRGAFGLRHCPKRGTAPAVCPQPMNPAPLPQPACDDVSPKTIKCTENQKPKSLEGLDNVDFASKLDALENIR